MVIYLIYTFVLETEQLKPKNSFKNIYLQIL